MYIVRYINYMVTFLKFKTRLFVSILVISQLSAFFAYADDQSPLTLDAAITEALKDSPMIQSGEAQVRQSDWRKFQAVGSGFLPKLSVGFNHYLADEYQQTQINFGGTPLAFPGAYPTNILTASATLPIFDGLANIYNLQAASLEQNASEQEFERTKFQLTQDLKLTFFQALAAAKLQDVASENVKTLEDHLKQVEIQRNGGAATKYDSLRVSVQLSEGRADEIDAIDNAALARKKLTTLLGHDQDDRPLQGDLPVPDVTRAQNLEYKGVPAERTDINALDLRARAADKTRAAQNSWFIPSVAIVGQYNYYEVMDESTTDGSVSASGNYKNAYSVAVAFSWNIFDGGVALAQSRQASYQQIQADKKTEAARLQVPYDFSYWKKRFLSNTDHYQARKFDVERSEESVRLAKEEEKAGTRTSTETLDAELDLFRSRAGVVNAQVNALEAQIRLESALGRNL
jgi:outer membrane protein